MTGVAEREMCLREYLESLPEHHRARKEHGRLLLDLTIAIQSLERIHACGPAVPEVLLQPVKALKDIHKWSNQALEKING